MVNSLTNGTGIKIRCERRMGVRQTPGPCSSDHILLGAICSDGVAEPSPRSNWQNILYHMAWDKKYIKSSHIVSVSKNTSWDFIQISLLPLEMS